MSIGREILHIAAGIGAGAAIGIALIFVFGGTEARIAATVIQLESR